MNPKEQEFLDYIAQQPWQQEECRQIYADWLEEQGRVDDANRQRQWVKAATWMYDFAEDCTATYEEIIEAGKKFVEDGTPTQVGTDFLGFAATNAICEGDIQFVYWKNFAIITGIELDAANMGEPFACCY